MKDNSDQAIAEKILETVSQKNRHVLEIGCGDGRITSWLTGKFDYLAAIDPDQDQIEKARNSVQGVDFFVGSGEELVFPNNRFDLVIFTLSLHHQNSSKALGEASRVLKDSGEILVIEPKVEGDVSIVFGFIHNEDREKNEAKAAIEESSLKIDCCETISATWDFDDKEELCRSLFEYYDQPYDSQISEKVVAFLGEKSTHVPIELEELLTFYVLRKP